MSLKCAYYASYGRNSHIQCVDMNGHEHDEDRFHNTAEE